MIALPQQFAPELTYQQRYYRDHREHIVAKQKAWREAHRDRCRESSRRWRQNHPEAHTASVKRCKLRRIARLRAEGRYAPSAVDWTVRCVRCRCTFWLHDSEFRGRRVGRFKIVCVECDYDEEEQRFPEISHELALILAEEGPEVAHLVGAIEHGINIARYALPGYVPKEQLSEVAAQWFNDDRLSLVNAVLPDKPLDLPARDTIREHSTSRACGIPRTISPRKVEQALKSRVESLERQLAELKALL
jgi:hypothetical protein